MRTKLFLGMGFFLAVLNFGLAAKDSQALTVVPLKLSQIVTQNVNGVTFNGTVTNVNSNCVAPNRMQCTEITATVNSVVKGNFKVGDSYTYRLAKGLGLEVPQVGKSYIFSLYNPSSTTGLTSYVGFSQGLFPIDTDGNTNVNSALLKLKTLRVNPSASEDQKNLQTKSLTKLQKLDANGKAPATDLEQVMRGLVNQTIVQD